MNDEELIRRIASLAPGTTVELGVLRDAREQRLTVKLAERPERQPSGTESTVQAPIGARPDQEPILGLTVRDLDGSTATRLELPRQTQGVFITRVEPLSTSFDADIRPRHRLARDQSAARQLGCRVWAHRPCRQARRCAGALRLLTGVRSARTQDRARRGALTRGSCPPAPSVPRPHGKL